MRNTLSRLALAMGLGLAAGCGESGPDVLGMWQVVTHTENESACDAEGPAVADPPYIRVELDSFLGTDFRYVVDCDDAAGTSCSGGGFLFSLTYADRIEDGYSAEVFSSSGTAASCSISRVSSTLVLESSDSLRIETRIQRETLAVPTDADCNTDLPRERADTMPCANLEVITATRVVAP